MCLHPLQTYRTHQAEITFPPRDNVPAMHLGAHSTAVGAETSMRTACVKQILYHTF
jgi:hypothetical protein